ncbi:DUF433 domain-containing protein [Reyranella sp.]|uniref:DUF433 domain-containing protein n=1 Tax=Reyranella sp. TaxID=1929291 RepID=UPI003D114E27
MQLIEVAVVAAMRRGGIRMPEILATRAFMQNHFKAEHPFAEYRHGHLIRTGQQGQLAWAEVIGRLKEFEYGRRGIVVRWRVAGNQSAVVIDPRVSYGSPNVRGVPTWIIKGRWDAGEVSGEIADDFRLKEREVSDALKFEGLDPNTPRPNWPN